MSRDCPNPSSEGGNRGGRDSSGGEWSSSYSFTAAASTDDWGAEVYAPVVAGHMSRKCTNPSSSGGRRGRKGSSGGRGGGGSGSRPCFKVF